MSTPPHPTTESSETETQKHIQMLLARIDSFIAERGWAEGYFSKQSAGDIGVVHRLRTSGKVTGAKMVEIENYLNNPPKTRSQKKINFKSAT